MCACVRAHAHSALGRAPPEPQRNISWRRCACADATTGRPVPWSTGNLPNITVPARSPSRRWTGMMPVPMPLTALLAFSTMDGWAPGEYQQTTSYGRWFSHPHSTQCHRDHHQHSGSDGTAGSCTIERRATMVYGRQLLAHGWNTTDEGLTRRADGRGHVWRWVSTARTRANTKAFIEAFEALQPRCCGC